MSSALENLQGWGVVLKIFLRELLRRKNRIQLHKRTKLHLLPDRSPESDADGGGDEAAVVDAGEMRGSLAGEDETRGESCACVNVSKQPKMKRACECIQIQAQLAK